MKKKNKTEDLEYNDGFGDLLREKSKVTFSWPKTIFLLVIIVFVVFLSLTIGFNFLKSFLLKKTEISLLIPPKIKPVEQNLTIPTNSATLEKTRSSSPSLNSSFKISTSNLEISSKNLSEKKDQTLPQVSVKKDSPSQALSKKNEKKIQKNELLKKNTSKIPEKSHEGKEIVSGKKMLKSIYSLSFKVIVGSFFNSQDAFTLAKELKNSNIEAFIWSEITPEETRIYRVQVAALVSEQEAKFYISRLEKKGFKAIILKRP